jgi:hypothetical protein
LTDISKLKRYPQPVEVRPDFKLTMSGSHAPEICGGDDGIWRRACLVDRPADRRRDLVELLTGRPADNEGRAGG